MRAAKPTFGDQPAGSARITHLLVHHTVTARSATVEDIRRIHVQGNGWDDIGYHYLLRCPSDTGRAEILTGRLEDGDPWLEGSEYGAHAFEANAYSLAISLVGNFHEEPVPAPMWDALVQWLTERCFWYDLKASAIVGHREANTLLGTTRNNTVCPGQYLDLDKLRAEVAVKLFALNGPK